VASSIPFNGPVAGTNPLHLVTMNLTATGQHAAAKVLFVRAVEEVAPESIPPEALIEAHLAAGDPADGIPWIVRRAEYLTRHVLDRLGPLPTRPEVGESGVWLTTAGGVVLGLGMNFLGPGSRIHVMWNPAMLLVLWNLVFYTVLLLLWTRRSRDDEVAPAPPAATPHVRHRSSHQVRPMGLSERLVLGPAARWLLRVQGSLAVARDTGADTDAIVRRYVSLWIPIIRPRLRIWMRRTLHLGAIGLAVGAVAGMYLRGVFFEYNVVWRSTFLADPETFSRILGGIFGPGAAILGYSVTSDVAVSRLLSSQGDPAAPWIHIYALYTFALIVVPRSLLAFAASTRLAERNASATIDFGEAYFRDLLRRARLVSLQELEQAVRDAVDKECGDAAERLSEFVCVRLYDDRIAPLLWKFREEGGSIRALEESVAAECHLFGARLEDQAAVIEAELEERLTSRIRRLLGEGVDDVTSGRVRSAVQLTSATERAAEHVSGRVGGNLAMVVGGVVSGSLAVTAGLTEAIGITLILTEILIIPVGLLMAALAAVAAGGAAVFGRGGQKLGDRMKGIPIPAYALTKIFWPARYERLVAEGRDKCREAVEASLIQAFEPIASQLSDHVWTGLRPVIGDMQRPRVHEEPEPKLPGTD
jgi:hypothetical protein